MNLADLVDAAVAAQPKLTKAKAKALVNGVFKAAIEAAASKKIAFTPAKQMKDAVNS